MRAVSRARESIGMGEVGQAFRLAPLRGASRVMYNDLV